MEQKKMIMNMDPDQGTIKLIEGLHYVLRLQRIQISPKDPSHPTITYSNQFFTQEEYLMMIKVGDPRRTKNCVNWQTASGVSEAKILHDPSLLSEKERAAIQQAIDETFKRPATPGSTEDIQQRLARVERQSKRHTNALNNESKASESQKG